MDELSDQNHDGQIDPFEMNKARILIIFMHLRRLYEYDRDLAAFFNVNEDGWVSYWEINPAYRTTFYDSVFKKPHKNIHPADTRLDANYNGFVDEREIEEYLDKVLDAVAMLPLHSEDLNRSFWTKEALFDWVDVNHNGELEPPDQGINTQYYGTFGTAAVGYSQKV
ncbi:hypothetical protein ES703_101447 [subsurface metagenome]